VTKRRGGCRFRPSNFMKRRLFRWTSSAGRGRNVTTLMTSFGARFEDGVVNGGKKRSKRRQKRGKVANYSSHTAIDCNTINW
jgi:hypothetical protein